MPDKPARPREQDALDFDLIGRLMLAGRSTGQAGEIDLCDLDDGIGAAEDVQFAQNIRYMDVTVVSQILSS